MSQQEPIKLIPRNVAALRRGQRPQDGARQVSGNPVSTRLESGVGNCFPGLECDLRNLERRFFPFLEVDIADAEIRIVSVDLAGVNAAAGGGEISAEAAAVYRLVNTGITQGRRWIVSDLQGTFGPLGVQTVTVASLAPPSAGAG